MTILLVLTALAVPPVEILPAEAEKLSAGEVIARSEAAYAGVKTYVGTTKVQTQSDHGVLRLQLLATAKVTYMRPGKVHIEGRTASVDLSGDGGHKFTIISDGTKTWKWWALHADGAFKEVKNVAMSGMLGVSQGVSDRIPAALMKSDGVWVGGGDPFIIPRLSPSKIEGHETVDGLDCYQLLAEHLRLGTVRLWIDSRTFFLRKMVVDHNEEQLAENAKRAQELADQRGMPRAINRSPIKWKRDVYSFLIYDVDGVVDETLFADPTQK